MRIPSEFGKDWDGAGRLSVDRKDLRTIIAIVISNSVSISISISISISVSTSIIVRTRISISISIRIRISISSSISISISNSIIIISSSSSSMFYVLCSIDHEDEKSKGCLPAPPLRDGVDVCRQVWARRSD